jgi:pimeloyl-ACP methyl ester carboxylesterase
MAPRRVVFLGGNGHCTARLALARPALADAGMDLVEVLYPAFEGRPRARNLAAFLDASATQARAAEGDAAVVYATGIGGLIALCLRARGGMPDAPLILQAPVLWGLDRRVMPRLMRLRLARATASRLFATPLFQRRFVRRHFMRRPSTETQAGFFEGYARCAAFPDLFAWFTPHLLRDLEERLASRPEALRRVTVWWGGRDRIVTPEELRWTPAALGGPWPLRVFQGWGHYPMIDDPEDWARALRAEVD